jgi:hypothetical protein
VHGAPRLGGHYTGGREGRIIEGGDWH